MRINLWSVETTLSSLMMLYNFLTKVFDESCPQSRFSRLTD